MGSQRVGHDWATFTFIETVNSKTHAWSPFPLTDRITVIIFSRIVSRFAWVTTKHFHVNQKGPCPLVGKRGVPVRPQCPQLLSLLCCVDHHGSWPPWAMTSRLLPEHWCPLLSLFPACRDSLDLLKSALLMVVPMQSSWAAGNSVLALLPPPSPSESARCDWSWEGPMQWHTVPGSLPPDAPWLPCQVLSFSFL